MNFDYMPELGWVFGHPFALTLMLVMGIVLYLSFKHRKWPWTEAFATLLPSGRHRLFPETARRRLNNQCTNRAGRRCGT